jgi:orotate phosphoribosyltransferase
MAIANNKEIAAEIIKSGAVEVRDVDSGEQPFVYSTGNRGPGYVMIKGLVGQPKTFKFLIHNLAQKLISIEKELDFVEGNATGGMIPGWQLRNELSDLAGREFPYCYLRGARKEGGHGELITGDRANPHIKKGMRVLIVEELVNYAGTTTNAAEEFRAAGYKVDHAACILYYDTPESNARLQEKKIKLTSLITLPQLLEAASEAKLLPQSAIQSYKDFLKDPTSWQLKRNLVIPEGSAQKAETMGIKMLKLESSDAVKKGAPADKVNSGVVYYAQA